MFKTIVLWEDLMWGLYCTCGKETISEHWSQIVAAPLLFTHFLSGRETFNASLEE